METLKVVEGVLPVGILNTNINYYDYGAASSSSPRRFFYSAPTSPLRSPSHQLPVTCGLEQSIAQWVSDMEDEAASRASASSPGGGDADFEFSARFSEFELGAASADELFINGQIKPIAVAAHTEKSQPQVLWPFNNFEDKEQAKEAVQAVAPHGHMEEAENKRGRERGLRRDMSMQRRTRSLSPLRNSPTHWEEEAAVEAEESKKEEEEKSKNNNSGGKKGWGGSKRWTSLADFLYRSKSEGRCHTRDRFWPLSFSRQNSSEKHKETATATATATASKKQQEEKEKTKARKKNNGGGTRKVKVSAQEAHYTTKKAEAEELKKRTNLPYRQGGLLFGYLGVTSKSHTTVRTRPLS